MDKVPSSQSYGPSTSHVWTWELDLKESWVPKNWCFWTVVLEKTLDSPLDCKEITLVNPKGNQSWIFTGRTDAEAEAPILWPLDVKNWLTGKDLKLGKIEGRRDDRGWDGWMASLTQWTWVWASSRSWWWTGRQSMGSQRVGHDWVTELEDAISSKERFQNSSITKLISNEKVPSVLVGKLTAEGSSTGNQ